MFRLIFFALLMLAFAVAYVEDSYVKSNPEKKATDFFSYMANVGRGTATMVKQSRIEAQEKAAKPQAGRTYLVKATGGKKKAAVFNHIGGTSAHIYLNDGDTVKIMDITRLEDQYRVKVGDNEYLFMNLENIGEETAESAQKFAAAKKAGRNTVAMGIGGWVVIILGWIIINAFNKKRAIMLANQYYDRKMSEHPWLAEWVKKHGNPAKTRGLEVASGAKWTMILSFFGIAIVLSFFIGGTQGWGIVGNIIGLAALFGASFGIGRFVLGEPPNYQAEEGLFVECPNCHCPHAWGMLTKQNVVEEKETKTTTTTTKRWEEDSSGKVVDWSTTTEVKKKTKVYYSGYSAKEFACDNCGHTHKEDYGETWVDVRPNEEFQTFSPPRRAWAVGV